MQNHPFPAELPQLIVVSGDDRAIGRQHAEQVGKKMRVGMPRFFYDFWRRISENAPRGSMDRTAFRLAVLLTDHIVSPLLTARLPRTMRARLDGLAEASGSSKRELVSAVVLPDLLPLVQSWMVRMNPRGFVAVDLPTIACSSFVSRGLRFLHGRNLDFPGVGYWDRYPVIQLTRQPGCIPYLGFTSAGVPLSGITGINAEGISLSLHQHYCSRTSFSGTLPFLVGEEILGKAKTLGDAIRTLEAARFTSGWAFVISDAKARDAVLVEVQPRKIGIRRIGECEEVLAHSNYFQTTPCKPAEFSMSARMNWDNYWRKTRLEQNVRNAGSDLDIARALGFLSEHWDPYWEEEKILNRTVSQTYNIQSLLWDLDAFKVYLAEGNTPIHLRQYREYDLNSLFSEHSKQDGQTFPAYRFQSDSVRTSKEHYILGFVQSLDGNESGAIEQLEAALEAHFTPESAYTLALAYLKRGTYRMAYDWLTRAKECVESKMRDKALKAPPEYFEIVLYLARTCDLLERRTEATTLYRLLAASGDLTDSNLKRIAMQGGPYSPLAPSRIVTPFSSYIPFS